jgi:phospholipid-binding lipoprotein MlaA
MPTGTDRKETTLLAKLLLLAALGGCANVPPEQRVEHDPWEPLNRTIYGVNTVVDNVTLKPLAKGYDAVLPSPVRTGIRNFFSNLLTPQSAVNNFLQGKPGDGFTELARFAFNSTVGIGGLLDVAASGGMEAKTEDLAQTAAVWGVPAGPYVTLPFLGPHTLRGAILRPFAVSYLLYSYDNTSVRDKLQVLRLISIRSRILAAEKFIDDSQDRYITIRESYLQNREYEIYDGNPPEDDEFFDEFFDDEDM